MKLIEKLEIMRSFGGARTTLGLGDETIAMFSEHDRTLNTAIDSAFQLFEGLQSEFPEVLSADEMTQIGLIQHHYINFYSDETLNPYVALAGAGPWVVTAKGAVLHDSGGYGMLGFGHAPHTILAAMNQPHVMANVMTASFSQLRLDQALRAEIGHTREQGCPFSRFLCLNSGSESVTAAARISDVNAKLQTDPGKRHAGARIRILSLKGGFHGRTDRPAQYSDSSLANYKRHLASFRDRDNLITIPPNDLERLEKAFREADQKGYFIESFFMEPVMGEGNPGMAITPEFYALARKLTREHGGLLLVDSIQAGLRAHGCLSIVDYPGFERLDAPDMETYSKALNAGQYPLSVLAMHEDSAALYRKGIYGNTLTTNPRALDIACAVLNEITPQVRNNIRQRGLEFQEKLQTLASEMGGLITNVQGTGLLFSCEVDRRFKAYGTDSLEEYLRIRGIGVIHGGENSLRFTPHFAITGAEVDLIISAVRDALLNGPRKGMAA